ncbi:putative RNA-directed DNA polymerase from transposon BS, partial [Fusarium oxysporum f. sp. albedinis]
MILLAVHMLGPKYTEGAYHEVEASSLRSFW